ncbi:MAG: histidine kinase dimerization/phospho-acceptor domain-containing protein, partial [Bacteroidota bacterium]
MANVFVLLSPIALWLMLKEYISGAKFEQKLFLYGSISFSLLAVISVISFVIDESLAGAILQIGAVLHIIIFVVGLSYHHQILARINTYQQNRLLAELQDRQMLEQELKQQLESKVKIRTAALEEQKSALELAIMTAKRAEQSQENFYRMMQYEIRTPMHTILGISKLIQEEDSPVEKAQMLKELNLASANLLGVINNVLDFSQIESGKLRLEAENISLAYLSDGALEAVMPQAGQKGIVLTHELDSNLPAQLYGAGVRVHQVLVNLFVQLIELMPGGSLSLRINKQEQNDQQVLVRFTLEYVGDSLSFGERQQLSEKIAQTQTSQDLELGMMVVHRLLHLMGSKLQLLACNHEGEQLGFYFDMWLGLLTQ